jgi:serine/threonine-protein kinase
MQDDKTAAPGSDPETEVALTRAAEQPPLAWSQSDEDGSGDETLPFDGDADVRRSWAVVGVAVALVGVGVVAAAWMGGEWLTHRDHRPAAQPPAPSAPDVIVPSTPAPTPGPMLNGTYQMAFDAGAATYTGKAAPPKRTGIDTIWWAFRSTCTAAGCTASGVRLDPDNHSVRRSRGDFNDTTLTYAGGQWANGATSIPPGIPGCSAADVHWTLQPQTDGTLTGSETVTVEGDCTSAGNAITTPIVATRIGPVPAGLLP